MNRPSSRCSSRTGRCRGIRLRRPRACWRGALPAAWEPALEPPLALAGAMAGGLESRGWVTGLGRGPLRPRWGWPRQDGAHRHRRPVEDQQPAPASTSLSAPPRPPAADRGWPGQALAHAEALHRQLAIPERDWHTLKTQRPRRGAEQLSAALVQLLRADDPRRSASSPAREQAVALVEHALLWLRAEISDPGCPSHGR